MTLIAIENVFGGMDYVTVGCIEAIRRKVDCTEVITGSLVIRTEEPVASILGRLNATIVTIAE